MTRTCDNCDRRAACVRDYNTTSGETQQCCRCTNRSEADTFCDDCRDSAEWCPGCGRMAELDDDYERGISFMVPLCDACRAKAIYDLDGPQSAAEARGDA